MIGTASARASRFAHGLRREPHRGVFAPRSSGTVFSLIFEGIFLDDLFLSLHISAGTFGYSLSLLPALDAAGHCAHLRVSPRTESPHSRNLLDDLSTSITGTLTMSSILSTSCNSGLGNCFSPSLLDDIFALSN